MNLTSEIQNFLRTFIMPKSIDIIKKKNSDYSGGEDGYKNFTKIERLYDIPTEYGFLTRMSDKLSRIENIFDKKAKVKDETIEDTILDLINYSNIYCSFIKSKDCTNTLSLFENINENYDSVFVSISLELIDVVELDKELLINKLSHKFRDVVKYTKKYENVYDEKTLNVYSESYLLLIDCLLGYITYLVLLYYVYLKK